MGDIKISDLDTVTSVAYDDLAVTVIDTASNGTKNITIGNLAKSIISGDADNLLEDDTNGLIKADADNFISANANNLLSKGTDQKLYVSISDIIDDLPESSTVVKGIGFIDKHWIWGFIPASGTNSDEEITILLGRAVCKDGSTIVLLDSTETDLDMPTLLGGALANDTSYHLFRYLKNDDTYQWYVDTTVAPTIADMKSSNAYRRICSFLTDSSGDIRAFAGDYIGGGIKINYRDANGIQDRTGALTVAALANLTLSIPTALELTAILYSLGSDNEGANISLNIKDLNTPSERTVFTADGAASPIVHKTYIGEEFRVNSIAQIQIQAVNNDWDSVEVRTWGFNDRRNYY